VKEGKIDVFNNRFLWWDDFGNPFHRKDNRLVTHVICLKFEKNLQRM
ncbi:MAG: hypothetical protein RI981_1802, partial [Bacteroidota bacterium]